MKDAFEKSKELGLPLFYQQYPEFFDTPSNLYCTNEKNAAIEQLLDKYGVKTILDMTCGTGAQVLFLTKRGYRVIGSDFSPGLLEIAREKAAKQQITAQFIDGDVRQLQLGQFDAVITIDNAIGHLVKDDFDIALKNIHGNLKGGGIYLFDILNLEAMSDEVVAADNKRMTDKRTMTDGTVIYNVRHSTIDRENGYLTSDNNFTISKEKKQKKVQNRCTLQIYTMNELEKMLSKNGFQAVEQHRVDAYTFQKDDAGYSILTVAKKEDVK